MSHSALKPINLNFDYRFIVGIVWVIGIIALCLEIRQSHKEIEKNNKRIAEINKELEENAKKKEEISKNKKLQIERKIEKNDKEIEGYNKRIAEIGKELEKNVKKQEEISKAEKELQIERKIEKNDKEIEKNNKRIAEINKELEENAKKKEEISKAEKELQIERKIEKNDKEIEKNNKRIAEINKELEENAKKKEEISKAEKELQIEREIEKSDKKIEKNNKRIAEINKELEENIKKYNERKEEIDKIEKNNIKKEAIVIDKKENNKEIVCRSDIEIQKEESIAENIDTLDISGDVRVEINVNQANASFIKIIGDKNLADHIKMKTVEKCLKVSQGNYTFEHDELLKCIVNVKQLNEITIAGNVHITKIDSGYNAMVKSIVGHTKTPPIDDKNANNIVKKIYQNLPVLKITTKDNSKISDERCSSVKIKRSIELCSFGCSSLQFSDSFETVLKTCDNARVRIDRAYRLKIEARDNSRVGLYYCSHVTGDQYDKSGIGAVIPDCPMVNTWIYDVKDHRTEKRIMAFFEV